MSSRRSARPTSMPIYSIVFYVGKLKFHQSICSIPPSSRRSARPTEIDKHNTQPHTTTTTNDNNDNNNDTQYNKFEEKCQADVNANLFHRLFMLVN